MELYKEKVEQIQTELLSRANNLLKDYGLDTELFVSSVELSKKDDTVDRADSCRIVKGPDGKYYLVCTRS